MFDLNSRKLAFAPFLIVVGFIAMPASGQTVEPATAKEGQSYADAFCSNRGTHVAMGDLSCLRVDGRVFLARCGMSLNNPVWREVQDGCPSEFNSVADKSATASNSSQPGTK